ncbi:MAG: TonB-dependent receptor [Candidatus Omnitrophica bacterium]|nr:TonB-dependent receptor [Candidatus Omnitrophota bacterium]
MKFFSLMIIFLALFLSRGLAQEAVDLGKIVVEASRSNDVVSDMNKNVSIISSGDITISPAKSLPELLSAIPGVHGTIAGNIHDPSYTDIGGFGVTSTSNVLVMVDGRRLNEPDLSGPDLSLIDLNSVDHIEVIQGAGTVLYGDNASGGVINIVTKKGTENTKPSVTLTSEVDSYKGNKDGIALSGGLPQLTYQFNYDRQQNDNYRTFDNYWANEYNTHLNYNPTDIFGVDFSQGYHLDRYRTPGGLTIDDINLVGPTGLDQVSGPAINTASDSHFDVTPYMKFDAGTSHFDFSLFASARKRVTDSIWPGYDDESLNYETESYEFQPKLIVSTPLTDRLDSKLTSGYDYIYNHEDRRSYANPEDVYYITEASQNVYLLDELTLDQKWLLNAGVRGAWADYVFDQTQQATAKLGRCDTTEGYDGGLGYKYNPDSKVFVDYSHSYRLPNIDEYFQSPYYVSGLEYPAQVNAGVTYQVGNQYQLGVKDQSFKGIHLGATFTEVQYKNEIFYDPNALPYPANVNYDGRTRHYSEEAAASVDLFNKKIEPFANITFQQSEFVKGKYSGNVLPYVPDHLANAGISFRPLDRLSMSFTTHFVGKEFLDADQANTQSKLKRYDTVDWNIKYGIKNIELWFTLQNIFSAKYYIYGVTEGPYGNYYWPAPGRNAEAGIKVKF